MTVYALVGRSTGSPLTYKGRVIIHDDRGEMEFLFPSARVVAMTEGDLLKESPFPPLPLPEHPDMRAVRFPLRRDDF